MVNIIQYDVRDREKNPLNMKEGKPCQERWSPRSFRNCSKSDSLSFLLLSASLLLSSSCFSMMSVNSVKLISLRLTLSNPTSERGLFSRGGALRAPPWKSMKERPENKTLKIPFLIHIKLGLFAKFEVHILLCTPVHATFRMHGLRKFSSLGVLKS